MIRLDAWIHKKIGELDSRYQVLKNSLKKFFTYSVSHTQTKRQMPNSSQYDRASDKSLKGRSAHPAQQIAKKTPLHHQTKTEANIKAEATLGLEVPQHQIASSHLTGRNFKSTQPLSPQEVPVSTPQGQIAPEGTTFHATLMKPGDKSYDDFMTGWKKLAGSQNYTRELIKLDKTSHRLNAFLATPTEKLAPKLSELQLMSEPLSLYKEMLTGLPDSERQVVGNYLNRVEELVVASREQVFALRKKETKAFLSTSRAFNDQCSYARKNPKKDFTLASLQQYDEALTAIAKNPKWDSFNDLRIGCFEAMLDIVKSPGTKPRTTRNPQPSALPTHPQADLMKQPYYDFQFEGDGIQQFSHGTTTANPYPPLLLNIAAQWQPDTPPPSIPDVIIKAVKPRSSQSITNNKLRYMIITNVPYEKEVAARDTELLQTSLCKSAPHLSDDESKERLSNMKLTLHNCWKSVCEQTSAPGTAVKPMIKEQLEAIELKRQIQIILEQPPSSPPLSKETIQHLHQNLAIIDLALGMKYEFPAG